MDVQFAATAFATAVVVTWPCMSAAPAVQFEINGLVGTPFFSRAA